MGDTEYLPIGRFNEYARRIDDEEKRQNKRLDVLEETVGQLNQFAVSMEKLAVNMEHISKEQAKQGVQLDEQDKKLDELKLEPGKNWKTLVTALLGAVAAAIGAAIMAGVIK